MLPKWKVGKKRSSSIPFPPFPLASSPPAFMRNKDLEKDWDPSFLLVFRGNLRKFTEHFTEMLNKTIFESHTVIGVTETVVYCSWEEANEWIVLASVSGCGTGKVPVKRFQFKCTSCLMKALLFLIWFYSVAPCNLTSRAKVMWSFQHRMQNYLSSYYLLYPGKKREPAPSVGNVSQVKAWKQMPRVPREAG